MYCTEPTSEKNSSSSNSKDGFFQVICFGTSIWGLVRRFDPDFYGKLIPDYQLVLDVEMGYFFSIISMIVFVMCFSCCFLCFSLKETQEITAETHKHKNNINEQV